MPGPLKSKSYIIMVVLDSMDKKTRIPLLYGHPSHKSIIEPIDWLEHVCSIRKIALPRLPKYCILSFKCTRAMEYLEEYEPRIVEPFTDDYEVFTFDYEGVPMCFAYLGVGAPLAGAGFEEVIALGVKYAILIGGVGSLKPEIERWRLIVPVRAIRDEGTSYHYAIPSTYSYPSSLMLKMIEDTLKEEGVEYLKGTVWTTDAPYRETIEKRREFMRLGAICVDMEASALFAIANFRGVHLGAIFYASDLVSEEGWSARVYPDHKTRFEDTIKKLLRCSMSILHRVHQKRSYS